MHKLIGCGLPNVHLSSGYEVHDDGAVSYEDVKGLFKAMARAVACRGADLTAHEFKFLRKRLGKSQAEIGELVGAKDQTVAKWEKGELPVPVAAGRLLRAAWLAENSKKDLSRAIEKMWGKREFFCHGYAFSFESGQWADVSHAVELQPIHEQAKQQTAELIESVTILTRHIEYSADSLRGALYFERATA